MQHLWPYHFHPQNPHPHTLFHLLNPWIFIHILQFLLIITFLHEIIPQIGPVLILVPCQDGMMMEKLEFFFIGVYFQSHLIQMNGFGTGGRLEINQVREKGMESLAFFFHIVVEDAITRSFLIRRQE